MPNRKDFMCLLSLATAASIGVLCGYSYRNASAESFQNEDLYHGCDLVSEQFVRSKMKVKLTTNPEVRAGYEGQSVEDRESTNKRHGHPNGSVNHGAMVTVNRGLFCNGGRLGNKIFMLASAFGIAERSNATFVLEEDSKACKATSEIQDLFEGVATEVKTVPAGHTTSWKKVGQKKFMHYDVITVKAGDKLRIGGYRQNFRYFNESKHSLRRLFKFRQHYLDVAEELKGDVRRCFSDIRQLVLVAVHLRRGDFMSKRMLLHGHNLAGAPFLNKSMSIMADRYGRDRIVFVVTSDTMSEAKKTMSNLTANYNVFFVEGKTAKEDFAILSSMDHMVTSGGTFGFWAAWLCGGDVIYFSEFARPGSGLEKLGYCMKCFNLPEWTPVPN